MVELKPYILPEARYFKIFVETTGGEAKITTSDIEGAELTTDQWIKLPEGFRLLDIIEDINVVAGTLVNRVIDIRINADGTESFFLPPVASYDYADFYVLGYFK